MKKLRLLGAAYACITCLIPFSAHAVGVSGQGTWETTLQARDLDGDLTTAEAYYDAVLNITWLADANYAYTSGYINTITTTYDNGRMSWDQANAWAASLNFNGITGWRLPYTNSIDGITADDDNLSYIGTEDWGYNVSAPSTPFAGSLASEMAHLFYNTFENKGLCSLELSTVSTCSTQSWVNNTGLLSHLELVIGYWSASSFAPDPNSDFVWFFDFTRGGQHRHYKDVDRYALAVHSGDVGVALVPIPPVPLDSDNDGLPDNIEDSNGNGVVDSGETDPLNPDSDNDGLLDGEEDINSDGVIGLGETNPLDFDSDDDGLTDYFEIAISGTDPNSSTTLDPGDMNGDGEVNLGDLLLLQRQLLGY